MLKRSALVFGVPLVTTFAACGGQTNDLDELSMAGASADDSGGSGGVDANGSGGFSNDTGGAIGSGAATASGASTGSGGAIGSGGGNSQVACLPGTYDVDLTDSELTCEGWSECPPGQRLVAFGSFDRDTQCDDCPAGTFSALSNRTSCAVWKKCGFGEQEDVSPSPAMDRTCAAADVFPHHEGEGTPGALAVTTAGAHLAVRVEYGGGASILSYPLSGASPSLWPGRSPVQGQIDLTYLGTDLYLAGFVYLWDEGSETATEPGFLQKFDQSGAIEWTRDFDYDPSEHFSSVQTAAWDDAIYVVGMTLIDDCVGTCEDDTWPPVQKLALRVLASDGQELPSATLEEDTNVTELIDITVSSAGRLFVAVQRYVPDPDFVPAAGCAEIDPQEDYESYAYYYTYCAALTNAQYSVVEFESEGNFVREYVIPNLIHHLSADDLGSVYTITNGYAGPPQVFRMNSGELEGHTVELEGGDWIDTFTVTDEGLLLVGHAEAGPVLYTIDANGEMLSRDVLEDQRTDGYSVFTGIQQTADGTVYVGGYDGALFVSVWP